MMTTFPQLTNDVFEITSNEWPDLLRHFEIEWFTFSAYYISFGRESNPNGLHGAFENPQPLTLNNLIY